MLRADVGPASEADKLQIAQLHDDKVRVCMGTQGQNCRDGQIVVNPGQGLNHAQLSSESDQACLLTLYLPSLVTSDVLCCR